MTLNSWKLWGRKEVSLEIDDPDKVKSSRVGSVRKEYDSVLSERNQKYWKPYRR